jgi:tetratricopeptide (TPR) repeat protein
MFSYFHAVGQSGLDEALAAARRAIELDPNLSEGHAALGLIHLDRKEGPEAVRALRHAINLSPGNAHAHGILGFVYIALDRKEEGWYHLQKSARLNPMLPETHVGLGYGYMLVGYPAEEALHEVRRAQELAPGYAVAYLLEGNILTAAGRAKEGVTAIRRGLERSSTRSRDRHLATLVYAYEQSGQRSQARKTLSELQDAEDRFFLGMACAALGIKDEAFDALSDVNWVGHHVAHLRYDRAFESLRSDARYGSLVQRVNSAWGLQPDGRFPEPPLRG